MTAAHWLLTAIVVIAVSYAACVLLDAVRGRR